MEYHRASVWTTERAAVGDGARTRTVAAVDNKDASDEDEDDQRDVVGTPRQW